MTYTADHLSSQGMKRIVKQHCNKSFANRKIQGKTQKEESGGGERRDQRAPRSVRVDVILHWDARVQGQPIC